MSPPIDIDGSEIQEATIDGQDVSEITIDGQQAAELNVIPNSGVSRWTFDNADTDSGTALDVWGNNDGTINGATTGVSGANQTYTTNEAYSFDGTDDEVDVGIPSSLDITGNSAVTIALWSNPVDTTTDFQNLAGIRSDSSRNERNSDAQYYLQVPATNGEIIFGAYDSNADTFISSPSATLNSGSWQHIVGMADPSTDELKVYRNGSFVGANTQSAYSIQDSDGVFRIGTSGKNYHEGDIDDVRVYNKALTDSEVSDLYNTGSI